MAQNRGLELAELAARDKPELVVELPAVALEGVERVRLPPRPVAREHDQAHEPLAERVLGEQPLALVEHGVEAAEPKLRLETGLVRLDPPLVQPLSVEAQAALDRVGDRRPAPEVERRPQESDRARSVVVGKRPHSVSDKPLEAKGFYSIITAATLIGVAIDFSPLDPFKALYWAAIVNGVVAVPIMAVMMRMAVRPDIMGTFVIRPRLRRLGWFATALMAAAVVSMLVSLMP